MTEVTNAFTNPSSLRALEWPAICALLAMRASRERNRAAFERLVPGDATRERVERDLRDVAAFQDLLERGLLGLDGIPEIGEICASLAVGGESLDGPELVALARFCELASELGRDVEARFREEGESGTRFHEESIELGRLGGLAFVAAVFAAIGPRGEVRDDASPELLRLRARTARLREDLDQVFETYLHKPNADDVLQDKVVASRNGRSVLMVKAEAKRSFGGVVHGASRAQKTAFVEPIEAVEVNNELVVVSEEEQEEIRQILRNLSERARADLGTVERANRILETWDALHAKARLARDIDARAPAFSDDGHLRIPRAIHPMLRDAVRTDLDLPKAARNPVPLDLELDGRTKILVIGGPNTGGKTVALKTVGLLALMARAGLPVPAGEGVTLPFFDSVFAEIGDEQSLGAGLSTFSAQIAGIAAMSIPGGGRSLVLLDELGSGTDPLEGGALGAAVIDDFARRGATVIATTHNADLKLFAQESPIGRCASFAYDPGSFAPTYKLQLDQPGRSLAFEIAARLGVPEPVVQEARARLPESARRQEAILADLAREKKTIAADRQALDAELSETRALRQTLDKRLAGIQEERERMREDTRARIQSRREAEDRRLRDLFAAAEERLKGAKTPRAVAKLRGETLADIVPAEERQVHAEALSASLAVGDYAEAPSLGWKGVVAALNGNDVELDIGGKRVKLGRSLVQRSTKAAVGRGALNRSSDSAPRKPQASGPSSEAPPDRQLLLLGMRVDEATPLVEKFLDDSFLADAPSLRIVHGFGQGRLRAAVRDLLKGHPHVASFRDGAPNEGGAGATVVELRQ